MAWLCIDAGTSLIKAVLLDSDGRSSRSRGKAFPSRAPSQTMPSRIWSPYGRR